MTLRALLLCGTAAVLMFFTLGCAPETPPAAEAEAAGEPAAPTGDAAQVEHLVLVNRMLASREMAVLGPYGHASVRSATQPGPVFHLEGGLAGARHDEQTSTKATSTAIRCLAARADLLRDRFLHGEIYKARPDVDGDRLHDGALRRRLLRQLDPAADEHPAAEQPAGAGLRHSARAGRRAGRDQYAGARQRDGHRARQEHDHAPARRRRRDRERIDRQRGERRP